MKRSFVLFLVICSIITIFLSSQAATPNVIIIMADDQGYQDLGCFGSPKIKTPHIDRMAKEGMRFTDFYSGAAVCTPSRARSLHAFASFAFDRLLCEAGRGLRRSFPP